MGLNTMCMNSSVSSCSPCSSPFSPVSRRHRYWPLKRHDRRVRSLNRRRRRLSSSKDEVGKEEKEMEEKNLKLYMQNQSIIQENERLRKKALLLLQENQLLLSQLQLINLSKSHWYPFYIYIYVTMPKKSRTQYVFSTIYYLHFYFFSYFVVWLSIFPILIMWSLFFLVINKINLGWENIFDIYK